MKEPKKNGADGVLPEPPGLPSVEEAKRRLDEIRAQMGDPPQAPA